jgi:hypothetical protein
VLEILAHPLEDETPRRGARVHPPIKNQFIELIYGVSSIDAEDNANYAKTLMIIAGADGDLSDEEWAWFYDRGFFAATGVPAPRT